MFLSLVVPIVAAWLGSGFEAVVGCENRSLGLLWYHLDRSVRGMWSCSELDEPWFVTNAQIAIMIVTEFPIESCTSTSALALDYRFLPMQFSFNVFSDLLGKWISNPKPDIKH